MPNKIRLLTAEDVDRCLTMPQVIEALHTAFAELHAGRITMPMRTAIPIPEAEANSLIMPVYLPSLKVIGLKVVNIFKNNLSHGLPAIHAAILLFSAQTGQPLALLDGERITALRTGAVSGLATRFLARKEARVVGIVGAGIQGRAQLQAVAAVRPIERALIVDVDAKRARAFKEEMEAQLQISVETVTGERLKEADVICTATTAQRPVLKAEWLRPGTHINGVGSYRPDMQEIPAELVQKAKIVVDLKSAALKEAGDLIIPLQNGMISERDIFAELGEIVSGVKPGRTNDEEITFFKSVGLAIQDLVTAHLALQQAEQLGVGSEISL